MKQLIATIICSAMIIALFCILPVTAQDASGQPSQEQRQEPIPLSDELTRKMLTSSEKKIPVMIRFRDDYNEASIEDEALIEAKNSKTSLSVARNKVLAKHVTLAREAFLNSAGIAAEDVESYCSLIPLISLARVTPEQIKQLTLHPNVLAIEYVDTAQKSETFALDGTTSIGGHIAPTNSYTGTNTRIGIVDVGHPNTSLLNEYNCAANVVYTNAGFTDNHATLVCGIMYLMVPDATFFLMLPLIFLTYSQPSTH